MATPSGIISEQLDVIDTVIQGLTAFTTQCGLDGVTPADQIHWHSWRSDKEGSVAIPTDTLGTPLILLTYEGLTFDYPWSGTSECPSGTGQIRTTVVDRLRHSDWQETVELYFNFFGSLIFEYAYADCLLRRRSITMAETPDPTQRREEYENFGYFIGQFDSFVANERV